MLRFFEGYRCGNCERDIPGNSIAGECPSCHGPLLGRYDLSRVGTMITRDEFYACGPGIWRFRPLLPPFTRELSLGEGNTPLLRAERLEQETGVRRLYIKDESANPTGSFKARGMAAAVTRALDLGAKTACVPSAGNAGLALSAYGASVGLETKIYIPSVTPEGVAEECRAYGSKVMIVEGILPDAAKKMGEDLKNSEGIDLSTFREPCRVEGKKTIAFELETQLEYKSPDWIIFPTGGGTGIVAIWKAYRELEQLGWLNGKRPAMAVVQSSGCAPVVRAFEKGEETIKVWESPETSAAGIRVPGSRADRQILEALRDTSGTAVAVDDQEIMKAAGEMTSLTGVFPSPEGAATLAGLRSLMGSGTIDRSASVVLVNTAGWSRYRFMLDPFRE
jgi:threonine synthase